jgi:hypothetical protein
VIPLDSTESVLLRENSFQSSTFRHVSRSSRRQPMKWAKFSQTRGRFGPANKSGWRKMEVGSANGNRTRISALKGPRANRCTIAPNRQEERVNLIRIGTNRRIVSAAPAFVVAKTRSQDAKQSPLLRPTRWLEWLRQKLDKCDYNNFCFGDRGLIRSGDPETLRATPFGSLPASLRSRLARRP